MATTSRKSSHAGRTVGLFALFIAFLYVIMGATNSWVPKLGLDLSGGTTVTLTARTLSGEGSVTPESLEIARGIMAQRVDPQGIGETEVVTSGDRQIIATAPNVKGEDLQRALGSTAQLNFRIVFKQESTQDTGTTSDPEATPTSTPDSDTEGDTADEPAEGEDSPKPAASEKSAAPKKGSTPKPSPTSDGRPLPALPTPVPSPRPTTGKTDATFQELLDFKPSEADLADFEKFKCGDKTWQDIPTEPFAACDETGSTKWLFGPVLIKGEQLEDAQAAVPQNSVSWIVNLKFGAEGTKAFDDVTTALSQRTEPENQFGIILDSVVISAPRVENAIIGGSAEISGDFNQKSATSLANILKFGALPLAFTIDSNDTVSAKLGGEQLRVGLIAGAIGLGLIIIYSFVYYRGLAVVVVASLGIAATLAYAMIVILGQAMGFALNLPGIAGVIMAIGVTADSFIIYFERIRDEAREGKSIKTAIETGWKGSRKTILAADSVSLLSAVVLYVLAMGTVKGFAFTLGLTTLIDVAIVFWFTKPVMTLLGKTKFYGEGHRFSGFEADHLGKRTPVHSSLPKGSEA